MKIRPQNQNPKPECTYPFGYRLQVGHRWPLYCTGPGKAILAFLPDSKYRDIISRISLKRYTSTTITGKVDLDKEMELIRETGYALDRGEVLVGCHCVSVPIFDVNRFPVAAIWASGPSDRLTERQFPKVGKIVMRYADLITKRLRLPL